LGSRRWLPRFLQSCLGHTAAEREFAMTKVLKCRDLGQDCEWEAHAQNLVELLAKAAEHARRDHHMTAIPPDMMAKAKAAIKDE